MGPREKIYDEEISPLVEKITKICEDNDIPLFINVTLDPDEDEEEDEYGNRLCLRCTTALSADDEDGMVQNCYNVVYKGYIPIPPEDLEDDDEEDDLEEILDNIDDGIEED